MLYSEKKVLLAPSCLMMLLCCYTQIYINNMSELDILKNAVVGIFYSAILLQRRLRGLSFRQNR